MVGERCRSGARGVVRGLVAAVAAAVVAVGCSSSEGAPIEPDAADLRAVILIHGWSGSAEPFEPMAAAMRERGMVTDALSLPGNDNLENARVIAGAVDAMRARYPLRRIALVAHSMGGLSARYYLKYLGGVGQVTDYVAMGTPQYGLETICGAPDEQGGTMCPGTPFMLDLNAQDDTPGDVRYTVVNSTRDGYDNMVDGGVCEVPPIPDVEHGDEQGDPAFTEVVLRALSDECPGAFVDIPVT